MTTFLVVLNAMALTVVVLLGLFILIVLVVGGMRSERDRRRAIAEWRKMHPRPPTEMDILRTQNDLLRAQLQDERKRYGKG